jgi:hypothetical protein
MKKSFCIVIVATLVSISFAYANSGPTYWQGYPSSDVMSIDNHSPIEVVSENLTFDFSNEKGYSFSMEAMVTAEYEMSNPTDEVQYVQMAFPFVGRLYNINYEDIKITADGMELPYEVYVGNPVDGTYKSFEEIKDANFEFADIVSAISKDLYEAKSFKSDDIGKLYIFEIKPTTDKGIDFTVDFNLDNDKSKVLIKNFNSFGRIGKKVSISSGCYKPEVAEIFVLGEDIDFEISAQTIGSSKVETDLYTYEVSEKYVDVKTYLLDIHDYVEDYYDHDYYKIKNQELSDVQVYNIYAKELDKYFTSNHGITSVDDIDSARYLDRIITLVYSVEFPPESTKQVSVTYKSAGTMDKRNTSKPIHSFNYILNPAENWSSFRDLNIKIVTPQEAPYIINSSIDFIKEADNVYVATLDTLPDEDLSFALYSSENISVMDKIEGQVFRKFGYFAPVVVGVLGVITLAIIVLLIYKIQRNR